MEAVTRDGIIAARSAVRQADAALTALLETQPAPGPDPLADARAFILGPQVPLGESPWPGFDHVHAGLAERWYTAFMQEGRGGTSYYDLALVLYQLHARSGDPAHLQMARSVALKVWQDMGTQTGWTAKPNPFGIAPRSATIASLCLLLLDEREGEVSVPLVTFTNKNDLTFSRVFSLAEWITEYNDHMNHGWLERWDDGRDDDVHTGIRDGGMQVGHLACAAVAHPDMEVRARMLDHALTAARDYYARVQLPDGSWRWGDADPALEYTQPFQVGLLLEGLIRVHQLTGDEEVKRAIVDATDAWYRDQFDRNDVPFDLLPGIKVRGAFYLVYGKVPPPIPPQGGAGNNFDEAGGSWKAANKLKVIRQRNPFCVWPFAYCAQITGDLTYLEKGDDVFGATFGAGMGGPHDDGHSSEFDDKGKTYNQLCRTAGWYLGLRKALLG